jgi:hypothetical protein
MSIIPPWNSPCATIVLTLKLLFLLHAVHAEHAKHQVCEQVIFARGSATFAEQSTQYSSQLARTAYDRWPSCLQLPWTAQGMSLSFSYDSCR